MIIKGQKRKLPSEGEEVTDRSSPFWENQRQFVFSVSLNKYQRGQELPEPSLRRSVLIANTLRQVSLEACGSSTIHRELSQPPSLSSCPMVYSNYLPNCAANWGSMSMDPDFSLSAAISSILTALDSTIDGSPQAAPRTPLRSLENLSGPCEEGLAWVKQGVRGYVGSEDDLTVQDLFQDIDTSLLEKDMGVLGLRGSGAGYPAGEDLLRYLPPLSSSSSSSPSYPFSLSLNQNLITWLTQNIEPIFFNLFNLQLSKVKTLNY
uniref:SERTA domain-containing protein n=1 Tax=Mola mola TaxID=94237 RepID=A0A3Q3W4F6_MOLML